jgi:hypothetical protein
MNALFSSSFWLNRSPGMFSSMSGKLLIGVIILSVLLAIASLILKNKKSFYRSLWGKIFALFITNALIGGVLYFFRQQIIPFLSSRIWLGLWALGMIAWAGLIIYYAKKLPDKKKQLDKEKEFKKYLP